MPVIPLNADFTNVADFINSLFSPGVRNTAALQSAFKEGKLSVAFTSEGDKILEIWQAAFLPNQSNTDIQKHCPAKDQILMRFLSGYLGTYGLAMFVPQIKLAKLTSGGQPIYALQGYTRFNFQSGGQWDPAVVRQFLQLFMVGAHFITIHSPQDVPHGYPPVRSLYEAFKTSLHGSTDDDPADSHYAKITSLRGIYFPRITSEEAKNPASFTSACLVGPTIQGLDLPHNTNTFMQLEGWPETRIAGIIPNPHGRHAADFATYLASLWNISTFGACAYSEKRGTAIFLAPPSWPAEVNPSTIMPPYAGATTPQPWLNKSLIELAC
jgi:hypothetical protein